MIDGLVLRYRTKADVDGLPAGVFFCHSVSGSPTIISCSIARRSMRTVRSLALVTKRCWLRAEEYDANAQRQLGNFPQAFSHLALIGTAQSLHDVGPAQQRGQGAKPAS